MDPTIKFLLVLVTHSWNGKLKLTSKGRFDTRSDAEARKKELTDRCKKCGLEEPDYRAVDPAELKALQEERKVVTIARRKKGAEKAAKTRAKNKAKGVTPSFILCPTCRAKSKKLHSEMGGLQTRKCQNGHTFEYDKWIADRSFWNPVAALPLISRPVSS
jgi:hypothetical protein